MRPTKSSPSIISTSLLFLSVFSMTLALPSKDHIFHRQSLEDLAIPDCALKCFINALTNDNCDSETDIKCHCTKGNVLAVAKPCVEKKCNDKEQAETVSKINAGCQAAGADPSDGDGGNKSSASSTEQSSTKGPSSTEASNLVTSSTPTSSDPTLQASSSTTSLPSNPTQGQTNPTSPAPNTSQPTDISSTNPTGRPAMPTDTPLALLPPGSRPLSPGAKAGISLSVSIFVLAILTTTTLYIRRLKRDLLAAQAAAGVPEAVWRSHMATTTFSTAPRRTRSWRGSRRERYGTAGEEMDSEAGVLKKKGHRGQVLSVVVERVEEEDERSVREPVPGQKEGIADALELDGRGTEVVELPTSVTPRTRSRERSRSRGRSKSLERIGIRSRGRSFGKEDRGK